MFIGEKKRLFHDEFNLHLIFLLRVVHLPDVSWEYAKIHKTHTIRKISSKVFELVKNKFSGNRKMVDQVLGIALRKSVRRTKNHDGYFEDACTGILIERRGSICVDMAYLKRAWDFSWLKNKGVRFFTACRLYHTLFKIL